MSKDLLQKATLHHILATEGDVSTLLCALVKELETHYMPVCHCICVAKFLLCP